MSKTTTKAATMREIADQLEKDAVLSGVRALNRIIKLAEEEKESLRANSKFSEKAAHELITTILGYDACRSRIVSFQTLKACKDNADSAYPHDPEV